MSEEKKVINQKQLETKFINDSELPTHFVNAINVRSGLEEFYFTLGAALPVDIKNIEDLEQVSVIDAQPFFRFAVTRTVMRQLIDLMETVYNQHIEQADALRQLQEQEGEGE